MAFELTPAALRTFRQFCDPWEPTTESMEGRNLSEQANILDNKALQHFYDASDKSRVLRKMYEVYPEAFQDAGFTMLFTPPAPETSKLPSSMQSPIAVLKLPHSLRVEIYQNPTGAIAVEFTQDVKTD